MERITKNRILRLICGMTEDDTKLTGALVLFATANFVSIVILECSYGTVLCVFYEVRTGVILERQHDCIIVATDIFPQCRVPAVLGRVDL